MIKNYAHVENNKVVNIAVWESEPTFDPSDTGIWVDVTDKGVHIGDTYDPSTGTFSHTDTKTTVEPEFSNQLIITNLTSDDSSAIINSSYKEITVHELSTITANFEVHNLDGTVNSNYSGMFRMPLEKQNGDLMYSLVVIKKGKGSLSVKMPSPSSGLWKITQKNINEKLPKQSRMQFDGLDIYVVI